MLELTPRQRLRKRSVRLPDDLWARLQALARDVGSTPSDVIRQILEQWFEARR